MKLRSLGVLIGLVAASGCAQNEETNTIAPNEPEEAASVAEPEDSGGEAGPDGLAIADPLPTTKAVLSVAAALRHCSLWDLSVTSEGIAHAKNIRFESHDKKKKKDPPDKRYADSTAQAGNTISMYNKTYRWARRGKHQFGTDAIQFDVVDGRPLTISGTVRACDGDMVTSINETITATAGAHLARTYEGERWLPKKPARRQAFLELWVHQTLPPPPPTGGDGGSTDGGTTDGGTTDGGTTGGGTTGDDTTGGSGGGVDGGVDGGVF
jgi:hypothetical protein